MKQAALKLYFQSSRDSGVAATIAGGVIFTVVGHVTCGMTCCFWQ